MSRPAAAGPKPTVQEGPCVQCGRKVIATIKGNPYGVLCCRSVACDALQHWSAEQWEARAHSPGLPWRAGLRVEIPVPGWCNCTGEARSLDVFVLAVETEGRAQMLSGCAKCNTVRGRWVDDPNVRGGGDPHRWLDFEASRRFPAAADRADWSIVSTEPLPPEPVVPVAPVVVLVPAGPILCLVVDATKDGRTARCGRHVSTKDAGSVPAAGMTGWGSQVSCPRCLS